MQGYFVDALFPTSLYAGKYLHKLMPCKKHKNVFLTYSHTILPCALLPDVFNGHLYHCFIKGCTVLLYRFAGNVTYYGGTLLTTSLFQNDKHCGM